MKKVILGLVAFLSLSITQVSAQPVPEAVEGTAEIERRVVQISCQNTNTQTTVNWQAILQPQEGFPDRFLLNTRRFNIGVLRNITLYGIFRDIGGIYCAWTPTISALSSQNEFGAGVTALPYEDCAPLTQGVLHMSVYAGQEHANCTLEF